MSKIYEDGEYVPVARQYTFCQRSGCNVRRRRYEMVICENMFFCSRECIGKVFNCDE